MRPLDSKVTLTVTLAEAVHLVELLARADLIRPAAESDGEWAAVKALNSQLRAAVGIRPARSPGREYHELRERVRSEGAGR